MKFLKRIFGAIKAVAMNAIGFAFSPILPIAARICGAKEVRSFSVFDIVGLIARVAFVASYFIAVPTFLLSLATAWLVMSLCFYILLTAFEVVAHLSGTAEKFSAGLESFLGKLKDEAAESHAVQVAEAATA